MSQPELAELKEQVYRDPRPAEHFDRFHARTRTREPDWVYDAVRLISPDFIAGDPYHNVVTSFQRWPVALVYVITLVKLGAF